jgi:hypothetical protein
MVNGKSQVPGCTVTNAAASLERVAFIDNVLTGSMGAQLISANVSQVRTQHCTWHSAPGDGTPDVYGASDSVLITDTPRDQLRTARGPGGAITEAKDFTNFASLQLPSAQDPALLAIQQASAATVRKAGLKAALQVVCALLLSSAQPPSKR